MIQLPATRLQDHTLNITNISKPLLYKWQWYSL